MRKLVKNVLAMLIVGGTAVVYFMFYTFCFGK